MISERFQELRNPSIEIERFRGLLNEFVAEGNQLDFQDKDGKTLLHLFVHEGYEMKVGALIEAGANIHGKCKLGRNVLSYAVEKCSVKLLEYLTAEGSLIDEADLNGNTPISYAAMLGDIGKFQALISLGASVDIKDLNGNSPMDHLSANWMGILKSVDDFIALTQGVKRRHKLEIILVCY